MILPNVRMSFGRREARWLVELLADDDPESRREWEETLADDGIDPLLDDPRTRRRIMQDPRPLLDAPPGIVLYVLIRQALLESGVDSRVIADYVTAVVLEFGHGRRSYRIAEHDDREYRYLVDILEDLAEADGRRAFLLRTHLGNFALWLAGLFPDHITHRVRRRGGPGLDYYEELGRSGYLQAADDPHARRDSLTGLYREAADSFDRLRKGLNVFSDRYVLPESRSPVDRLIRRARTDFHLDAGT